MADPWGPLVRGTLLVAGVVLLGVAARAREYHDRPSVSTFLVTTAGLGVAAVATAVADDGTRYLIAVVVSGYLPVVWAVFAFEYYGLRRLTRPRIFAALVAAATVGILVRVAVVVRSPPDTNPLEWLAGGASPLAWQGLMLVVLPGMVVVAGLFVGAAGLVLWTAYRYSHKRFLEGVALVVVASEPLFASAFLLLNALPPWLQAGVHAYAYAVSAAGAVVASERLRFFETIPAAGNVAPTQVLEELEAAVVVADDEGRLLRFNDAARDLFDVDPATAVGDDLSTLLGTGPETLSAGDPIEVRVDGGLRRLDPTVSEIADDHDHVLGYAVVLTDVTDRELREQRLAVFNRVLRHNLRNKMTAITGRAEMIADGAAEDPAPLADDIRSEGNELVALGERAREVERLMTVEQSATDCAVARAVDHALAAVGERFSDASLASEVPPDLTASVDPVHLETVLENLVDNGVRHDGDDPAVTVTGRHDPEADLPVVVEVADEGPGIPDAELSIIRDGEESPLEHGSGLGLWTVSWGSTRMGGTVEFESDGDGTTVTLRLPAS